MGIPKDSTAQRWVTYFAYLASKERTSYTQSIELDEQDCLSVLKILAPLMLMRKDTMLSRTKNRKMVTCMLSSINILHSLHSACYYF